ncbi:MAG: alpha/beta fold hydrolase [Clostridiales bacterium]|jgi:pimeloyl-ACP methyl ester carboxylesterase|nr:alpha/beta fold hydrolase [Clostridiales bacterium]
MTSFKSETGRRAIISTYDKLLSRFAGLERLRLKTLCGSTFAIACGNPGSPALVLLHAESANSSMWLKDMKTLGGKFRVYALDMPGEPGWSEERQFPLDSEDYPEWLLDSLARLEIGKACVAGSSLGAWLAAKFAARHPEMVEKLALVAPVGMRGFLCKTLRSPKLKEMTELEREIHEHFFRQRSRAPILADWELKRLGMPCSVACFAGGGFMFKACMPRVCVHETPGFWRASFGLTEEAVRFLQD